MAFRHRPPRFVTGRSSVAKPVVGQWLEFRNPAGTVTHAVVSGVEFFDPPNPDRPLAVPIRSDPPDSPIEIGAEVWSGD